MIDPTLAQQIVESATDFAIITFDEHGNITSWNPGAEAILGWSPEEAIGQHGRIIFTEEDQAAGSPEHELGRARSDGRAVNERFHLRQNGSRFWGSGLMMPLKTGPGFLKIVRDRTKEREVARRLASLTDALPGFVFEADADGHYVQTNVRFKTYTGRSDRELLGDRWLEAIHPKHRDRARDAWAEAIRTGNPFDETFMVADGDGEYRCFACRGIPEQDHQGRVLRWIGTCIDVENEAKARAMLEDLNLSLEHTVTDQVAALEESQRSLVAEVAERERVEEALRQSQKMEAIGQLTGGVAHDFNNLLTVILGSIDLLARPDLAEQKRQRYLASIKETAERAAKLTNQLLAFARRQPLKAEHFDVVERLRQGMEVLKTVSGSRVEIDLQVRCEPCVVHADPNQFETAILNMTVNARDAMEGEGRLTLLVEEREGIPATRGHAAVEGRFIAVAVSDTGSGISAEDLPRVFEPFFTTKDVGKGTGLGLSQVFGFAKQSGGDIVIESGADEGATFTLYLLRADERETHGDSDLTPPTATAPPSGGGCVLLVEDNQLVGEFAAHLIGDLGYGNMWVPSGQEALAMIEAEPKKFDIVFTDVVMPGISGIELAETLRSRFPELPVVLTSGYSHVLAAEGSHGFDLLQKPYTAEGLARVLRSAMSK
ncbi:PAS domain S-box protein [Sphingomonas sp. PL-96]|uniref:hybrid sensor histidine kinase/response regulator n=1 Tax=Sphingomonas sp. PL-96 TaxID=2887201 RepID=UPI001E430D27|nr:PAS domain-containing sensor histidine kinase [Sphingomonas sp. PL-96]MCC2975666.1 PAS domain S-box protein [Sphingomonas sp. PL-96]